MTNTLQDWAIARVVAEYDFPANAAREIVTGAAQRATPGTWSPPWEKDVTQADDLDKARAWDEIRYRIELMTRTDLPENIKRELLNPTPIQPTNPKHWKNYFEPEIIEDYKDSDGYRVLIIHASTAADLGRYDDDVSAKGRRVVRRWVEWNIWRIYTEPKE